MGLVAIFPLRDHFPNLRDVIRWVPQMDYAMAISAQDNKVLHPRYSRALKLGQRNKMMNFAVSCSILAISVLKGKTADFAVK